MKSKRDYNEYFCNISSYLILGIELVVGILYTIKKIDFIFTIMALIICVLAYAIIYYIKKLKKVNNEYQNNKNSYVLAVEAMKGSIWQWNDKTELIYISSKIKRLLGIENETMTLKEWYSYIAANDYERVEKYLGDICKNKRCVNASIQYELQGVNGKSIYIDHIGKGVIKNSIYNLSGVVTDITNEKIVEKKIHFMSYYDGITGIPNRKMFLKTFENLIEENKTTETNLALIFFDIDNFKNINDTYGHDVGDKVLLKICDRIHGILDERHIFARFGGDEFVIAFSSIRDEREVYDFLNNLFLKIRDPFIVNNKNINCSISVGVSMYPNDADDFNLLLKTADMATNKAKEEGKNRYKFFDIDILTLLRRQYDIEKALRIAIENNEISMVFQPKVSIRGEKVNGFEALVRWNNKDLGFVSPAEFIPIAESSGIIIDLGKYIIEDSFRKCKELYESTKNKFHIAINISDIQLREEGFIDYVADLLKKYKIPPEYIEFEITEGVIMQSVARNIELLLKLKCLGVSIALDDFGTGYSSLSYLKRLPIDVLKIDKSFVDGIGVDEKSEYIAESIIKLSHSLDLKVVAEGVETKEQLVYLERMKCDVAQGYYFSKPEKFEVIKNMV